MAKGIEMNGQLRGKRGGVVYYRAEGQQISRSRNFAPRNPRTRAQMIQRLMLSNASKAATGLKQIIDHSFEGIQYGAASVRHFQQQAQIALKATTPTAAEPLLVTPCVPMDALGFPVANFLVSSGTLASAAVQARVDTATGGINGFQANGKTGFTSLAEMTVQDFFDAIGVPFGCQLTIVTTIGSDSIGGAGAGNRYYDNEVQAPIRLNFKSDSASTLMFDQEGRIKADVLVLDKSNAFDVPTFTVDSGVLLCDFAYDASGYAFIVSAYVNGAWRRSTEKLQLAAPGGNEPVEDNLAIWGWNQWQQVLDSMYVTRGVTEEYFLNKEDNTTQVTV